MKMRAGDYFVLFLVYMMMGLLTCIPYVFIFTPPDTYLAMVTIILFWPLFLIKTIGWVLITLGESLWTLLFA